MAKTENYAELLKAERKTRKLSQEAMAELIDISPVVYGLWERGKTYPNDESVAKIRKATGIELGVRA